MPYQPRMVAGVEVTPLREAVGPHFNQVLADAFPNASTADWAGLDTGEWILHFRCYLLRDKAGRTVLVDTGIGGADSLAATWAPVPGALLEELAAAGAAPETSTWW